MKCQRVLVSYHFGPHANPLGEQISCALERMGLTVARFDSGVPRSSWDIPKRLVKSLSKLVGQKKKLAQHWERTNELSTARSFRQAALSFKPDLLLVVRGEPIDPIVVAELKCLLGAKAVLWWVKTMRWQSLMERDGGLFDSILTIHPRLVDDSTDYLPAFALDRERYFPPAVRDVRWPLLFVGCWSERRQSYLEAIADMPVSIIGPNWRKRLAAGHSLQARIVTDWVADKALADCYRQAAIVIDIGQIDRRVDEGVTMRVADVPACGAILATELASGVSEYFRPDALVTFDSPADLRQQLGELLNCPDQMAAMVARATVDVQKLPTFDDRARQILLLAGFSF